MEIADVYSHSDSTWIGRARVFTLILPPAGLSCLNCAEQPMKMNRRNFIKTSALALSAACAGCRSAGPPAPQPIPVILATDIGDDIDDTWALGFLLKSPELSLKLVATEYGKAPYRAKLLGKFLAEDGPRETFPLPSGRMSSLAARGRRLNGSRITI
jgi:hypothetical protein